MANCDKSVKYVSRLDQTSARNLYDYNLLITRQVTRQGRLVGGLRFNILHDQEKIYCIPKPSLMALSQRSDEMGLQRQRKCVNCILIKLISSADLSDVTTMEIIDIIWAIWGYLWPVLLIKGLELLASLLALELSDISWVLWGYLWPILLMKGLNWTVGLLFAPDPARRIKIVIAICVSVLRLGMKFRDGYQHW